MDAEPDAKRLMEDYAEDAARRSGLPEPQRSEARLELYSHLFDTAGERARAAGAGSITVDHARAAIGAIGATADVDAAFFAPRRAEMERAPFMNRAVAYVLDFILLMLVLNMILGPVMMLMFAPFGAFGDLSSIDCDPSPIGVDCHSAGTGLVWFAPFAAMMSLAWFAGIILAFAAFEATLGQTPGKMVMKLRATTSGGGPLSWQDAVLRNLTKALPFLLLLDAVLGHFAYDESKERISDHLVRTAVIREVR